MSQYNGASARSPGGLLKRLCYTIVHVCMMHLVDVGHGLHLLLCELALALVSSRLVLPVQQGLAVLVNLQLGNHNLARINTNDIPLTAHPATKELCSQQCAPQTMERQRLSKRKGVWPFQRVHRLHTITLSAPGPGPGHTNLVSTHYVTMYNSPPSALPLM